MNICFNFFKSCKTLFYKHVKFKFFWYNLAETLLFWKWLYQIQFALKIFRQFTRKSPSPLFQPLALQKSLPLDVECVNFPDIFQNTFFHKTLLCNSFCVSVHYAVFQKITFLISVGGNFSWCGKVIDNCIMREVML